MEYGLLSSHALNTVCLSGYLLHYAMTTYGHEMDGFRFLIGFSLVFLLVSLIGIGRIYLGMHSFIDVAAGITMGLVILAFWLIVHDYIHHFITSGYIFLSWPFLCITFLLFLPLRPQLQVLSITQLSLVLHLEYYVVFIAAAGAASPGEHKLNSHSIEQHELTVPYTPPSINAVEIQLPLMECQDSVSLWGSDGLMSWDVMADEWEVKLSSAEFSNPFQRSSSVSSFDHEQWNFELF